MTSRLSTRLWGDVVAEKRITYLHENPVRTGFVELAENWKFSSAIDYYTKDKKGLLEIVSVY